MGYQVIILTVDTKHGGTNILTSFHDKLASDILKKFIFNHYKKQNIILNDEVYSLIKDFINIKYDYDFHINEVDDDEYNILLYNIAKLLGTIQDQEYIKPSNIELCMFPIWAYENYDGEYANFYDEVAYTKFIITENEDISETSIYLNFNYKKKKAKNNNILFETFYIKEFLDFLINEENKNIKSYKLIT